MRMRTLLAIVGIAVFASVVPSSADITPILETVVATPDGFLWTYRVEVAPVQTMQDNGVIPTAGTNPEDDISARRDYLTIYDFAGLQSANPMAVQFSETGFDFRIYDLGATPSDVVPVDLAITPNVTIFRATDAGDITGSGTSGYTFFVALLSSVSNAVRNLNSYAGEGTSNDLGTGESNVGEIIGPGRVISQVPEPGTLLLMGTGLLALGMFRRKSS